MSTPDDSGLDPALGDSAMASGSDAGEPGEHLGPSELRPDEQRLLAELSRDVGGAVVTDAPEDDVAAVRAAEDEAPLPAEGGAPDDGLTPRFSSPDRDRGILGAQSPGPASGV